MTEISDSFPLHFKNKFEILSYDTIGHVICFNYTPFSCHGIKRGVIKHFERPENQTFNMKGKISYLRLHVRFESCGS